MAARRQRGPAVLSAHWSTGRVEGLLRRWMDWSRSRRLARRGAHVGSSSGSARIGAERQRVWLVPWTLFVEIVFTEFCRHSGLSPAPPRPLPIPGSSAAVATLKPPPAVYDDGSVRSIASLGSFPEPPSHFPIPPLTTSFSTNSGTNSLNTQQISPIPQEDGPMQSVTTSDVSASSSGPPNYLARVTESPLEESATPALTSGSLSPENSQGQPVTPFTTLVPDSRGEIPAAAERPSSNSDQPDGVKVEPSPPASNSEPALQASASPSPLLPSPGSQQRQQADPSPTIASRSSSSTGASSAFRRGDYLEYREFGVDNSAEAVQLKAKTLSSAQRRIVEGNDASKGNGGMVAAIRDKYSRAVSSRYRSLSHYLDSV
jgi:hypothetical protein